MTKRDELSDEEIIASVPRPKTYGDCLPGGVNAMRPCPWVSCRHHLYLSTVRSGVSQTEIIVFADSTKEVWEMAETCSLDVANRDGPLGYKEIAQIMNVSHPNVIATESKAIRRISNSEDSTARDHLIDYSEGHVKLRLV